ncbi:hypothetical protein JCGZ_10637 [Jatropha curcas]|uniref:Uncharacterized protein n=1 Tax=Jatropha curcas TaxID=180498 RepID=A0A067KLG2_JATCU|nr:hypothetical protein JCGZ_10637 [Jatropha curcas]
MLATSWTLPAWLGFLHFEVPESSFSCLIWIKSSTLVAVAMSDWKVGGVVEVIGEAGVAGEASEAGEVGDSTVGDSTVGVTGTDAGT